MKKVTLLSGLLLVLLACSPSQIGVGQKDTTHVAQKSLSPFTSANIQFQGIYESTESDLPNSGMFLRFYEDGTLVYKRSKDTIEHVKPNLNRLVYCRRCRSTYTISGNQISFETYRESNAKSGGIIHSNTGTINPDNTMTLVSYAKYDNSKFGPLSFVFVPVQFSNEDLSSVIPVTDPTIESRVRFNDEWDSYSNNQMGFSLALPNFVQTTYNHTAKELDIEQPDSYGWTIKMLELKEADTLESIIKKVGGGNCKIKENASRQGNNYMPFRITLEKSDQLDPSNCIFVGSAWLFYYNFDKRRIIYWNAGQELHFNITGKVYDDEMRLSFSFLQ